ncbi:MAG: surface carbohydrate biosynthesis protein [Pseudomonadota bacterium]
MPRWLIIPVEVKHREFLSRIVISALATKRNYRVILGKDTMIRRLAPCLPKGVLFDKSLGIARHGKPQRFSKLGYNLVVHDEESTGFYGSPEQFLSVRLAEETLEACKRWYCISDELNNAASVRYSNHQDRFLTSGLLRTDVWRKPLQGFYQERRREISQEHGPFILFNSNFGGIIHARGDAFVQKQIRGQKTAYAAVDQRTAKIFQEGRKNLDAFIDIIPKVARSFPNHKLVIRPHPSEEPSFWVEQFANFDNIVISGEGEATPWILASEAMFHHGCTTGIEAAILGKAQSMYAPHPDAHHDTDVMQAFSRIHHSQNELLDWISRELQNKTEGSENVKAGEKFFANISGALVSETILDDIDTFSFDVTQPIPSALPLSIKLRLFLADRKKRSEKEVQYATQKWPGTTTQEILEKLEITADGLGLEKNFSVREAFPQVFEISA